MFEWVAKGLGHAELETSQSLSPWRDRLPRTVWAGLCLAHESTPWDLQQKSNQHNPPYIV